MITIDHLGLNAVLEQAWDKLMRGRAKYGDSYKIANLKADIFEEMEDIPNYCFLIWQRRYVEEAGRTDKPRYDREDYDTFMAEVRARIEGERLLPPISAWDALLNDPESASEPDMLFGLAAWSLFYRIVLDRALADLGGQTSAVLAGDEVVPEA